MLLLVVLLQGVLRSLSLRVENLLGVRLIALSQKLTHRASRPLNLLFVLILQWLMLLWMLKFLHLLKILGYLSSRGCSSTCELT